MDEKNQSKTGFLVSVNKCHVKIREIVYLLTFTEINELAVGKRHV